MFVSPSPFRGIGWLSLVLAPYIIKAMVIVIVQEFFFFFFCSHSIWWWAQRDFSISISEPDLSLYLLQNKRVCEQIFVTNMSKKTKTSTGPIHYWNWLLKFWVIRPFPALIFSMSITTTQSFMYYLCFSSFTCCIFPEVYLLRFIFNISIFKP